MRRLHLTLAALALAIPTTAAEPIPWANKFFTGNTETPPPVILHDFGTLPKGTIKTYRFKMTNIYAYTMQVKLPELPKCSCVSVLEYTGQMGPRETGYIDIVVDTSKVEGPKTIKIPVKFDGSDPRTGEKFWSYPSLEVRVVSRPDIAINPGVMEFGKVPVGQKAAKTVTIAYSGRQRGWNITSWECKKELFNVTVKAAGARAGNAFEVKATLKDTAPAGAFDEQIVLKTNDKDSPALVLSVTGRVQPPLNLVGVEQPGNVLKLGGVPVGKKAQKNVIIAADKKFKVKSVAGEGDGVTVPLPPVAEAKTQSVAVVFAPEKPGPVKKELTVKLDTGETITFTVEAIGTEPQR
jgi:hypothetical protein